MNALRRSPKPIEEKRIILSGVGGQGVVFATRLLARAAVAEGYDVLASETHGMSQRGGSVTSHLKLGGSPSPLIRPGTADLLLAFDAQEGFRNCAFLSDGAGAYLSDDLPVPEELIRVLQRRGIEIRAVPTRSLAAEIGHAAVSNVILVAFAAAEGALPMSDGSILAALADLAPRNLELNHAAFELGRRAALDGDAGALGPREPVNERV